jgi:serine/threonine protein kinase
MSPEALALAPGTRIENLRIDRVLGQGAFGISYLVTDTMLDKSFALKEYLPRDLVTRREDGKLQATDEQAAGLFATGLAQFLEEGRTVAQLEHPNIVTVFSCLEANGTAYLLMPWYRGEALHKLLKRSGTFSQEEALALSRPLLDALDYIHRNGVIHQDIKPANIYITEEGTPILLDFGAAGQFPHTTTSTRRKLGSAGYAAVEQAEPGGRIGPWTDIYGLAATLYRCISGRIPTAADQRRNALEDQLADPLEPLAGLVPAQEFATVIAAVDPGLALEPAARPQSIGDWRSSFHGIAAGTAASGADAAGAIEQEGREWLPIILLSIFLLVLAAAVVYLFTGDEPQHVPDSGAETVDSPSAPRTPDGLRTASPEETKRWQSALEADTAYAYQLFMEDFPDSIHEDQAKLHLERLDHQAWGKTEFEGTRAAIEAYMENFPSGCKNPFE